jgi:hypothetical protein
LSPEINVIGQFIDIGGGIEWEMRCQLFPHFFDASDESTCEITGAKPFRNHVDNTMPKFLANALMYSAIAQHHKFSTRGHYEKQDAIVVFCARHSETCESSLGRFVNISPKERGNGDSDFT